MVCEKCQEYKRKIEAYKSQLIGNNEMLDKFSNLLDKQQNSIKEKDEAMIVLNEKNIKLQQENQKLQLLVKKYKENLNLKIEQQDKVADLPIPYQQVKPGKTEYEQAVRQRFTPHVSVKTKLLKPNLKKSNRLQWMRMPDDMRLNELAGQIRKKNEIIAKLKVEKEEFNKKNKLLQKEINNNKKILKLYENKFSGVSLIK